MGRPTSTIVRSTPTALWLAALGLMSGAVAPAGAQRPGLAPHLALTVGGVGAGRVASGTTVVTGEGTPGLTPPFTASNRADLRLDARSAVALEGFVPVGRRGWAVVANVARSVGRGTLVQSNSYGAGSEFLTFYELESQYAHVVGWTGSVGVARALPLPGAWLADVRASGTVGRLRAPGDPPCPVFPPGPQGTPLCLRRPAISLTTPGARVGAALYTPAWRGLRAQALLAGEALRPNGATLADPDGVSTTPASGSRRQTGRATRVLPTAALGLALSLPR